MAYWLFKTEAETFSWGMQKQRGAKGEPWSGVRNFAAAKHMKAMKKGDLGFFYHTGDEKQIVGIVDESDVLLHVYADETKFRDPVSTAMVTKLQKLDVTSAIEALLPVFDAGHVAIVMDADKFLGLITRIDLLNYLRRRVQ